MLRGLGFKVLMGLGFKVLMGLGFKVLMGLGFKVHANGLCLYPCRTKKMPSSASLPSSTRMSPTERKKGFSRAQRTLIV